MSGQTPKPSKMRRPPFDSAVVRSSKLGWSWAPKAVASISATLQGQLRERECKAGADQAAAGDRDVDLARSAHAALIHFSIASGSLTSPAVSTSLPSRVTATSSSMRTPMFHQRLATPFVPAGI